MTKTDRAQLAHDFIASAGWGNAAIAPLAGDASNRRYDRLTRTGGTAVLMDAPPEKGEDIRPFVRLATHLTGLGLSAPQIFASDATHGFLLLEDLGDALFARAIKDDPALETPLYHVATDLLCDLHHHAAPSDLTPYDPDEMSELGALPFDWYPGTTEDPARQAQKPGFQALLKQLLSQHCATADVLVQRDYHAENLLWLPDRTGIARVGLLDFQDGRAGHRAYDLISLLEDARRDVSPDVQHAMLARYIENTGVDNAAFRAAYACLGAQRNLRILGVFSRLCIRDGKAHYVDLIPRVWAHLQNDLRHPALAELQSLVQTLIPSPTADILERTKAQCATTPTR